MKIRLLGAMLLAAMTATSVSAAPTVQVDGRRTAVSLSDEFLDALDALGVSPGVVPPGKQKGTEVRFPVSGGALDLETARGDVFHEGGLNLTAGSRKVGLLNFVIDTTEAPVLSGLVTVDGDLVARVPLFDLELTSAPEVTKSGMLKIGGVEVTLAAEGAAALNEIFQVTAFDEGLPIGVAELKTRVEDEEHDEKDD